MVTHQLPVRHRPGKFTGQRPAFYHWAMPPTTVFSWIINNYTITYITDKYTKGFAKKNEKPQLTKTLNASASEIAPSSSSLPRPETKTLSDKGCCAETLAEWQANRLSANICKSIEKQWPTRHCTFQQFNWLLTCLTMHK